MDNPKLGPSNKKKGCPRAKRESINQPSDIYALILPVRGGMAFTGLGKLGPAKKGTNHCETIINETKTNFKTYGIL